MSPRIQTPDDDFTRKPFLPLLWVFLGRVTVVLVPLTATLGMAWGVWVTKSIHELASTQAAMQATISQSSRFTDTDGLKLKLEILSKIEESYTKLDARNQVQDKAIADTPNGEWRSKITSIEQAMVSNSIQLTDLAATIKAMNDRLARMEARSDRAN